MRVVVALPLAWMACSSSSRPAPFDAAPDTVADMSVIPDVSLEPSVDAPPPVDCAECIMTCLEANCSTQADACRATQCDPVSLFDGGVGPDAYFPPNCEAIVACLLATGCSPLTTTDPCFVACYGPACAEAQAAFDVVLDCATAECVDDCFGCQ